MDIHVIDTDQLLAEDVAKAHVEDLKVEDRYGVKQLKYWVDTDNKKVFCLMMGPDKEACNAVHEESHGMTACNMVELSKDEGDMLLVGDTFADLAYANSGALDSGIRTLVRIDFRDIDRRVSPHLHALYSAVEAHDGIIPLQPNDYIIPHFRSPKAALDCAEVIRSKLQAQSIPYTIGIISGHPLDETSQVLFEREKKQLDCLAALGVDNSVYVDVTTIDLLKQESGSSLQPYSHYQILSEHDLKFLHKLKDTVESRMADTNFTIAHVSSELGLSKATLYRTIMSLLGISPTDLIQSIRLKHATRLLTKSKLTVSEIGYASGFSSPSYFSRVFKGQFGVPPSSLRK